MMIEMLQAWMKDVVITDVVVSDDDAFVLDADRFDALGVVDGQLCVMTYNDQNYPVYMRRTTSGADCARIISEVIIHIVEGSYVDLKFNAMMSIESAKEYEPIIIDAYESEAN